jgi:KDO2-lipid IV(A) lauroyltransferase
MSQERNMLRKIRFALEYAGTRLMLGIATVVPLRVTSGFGSVLGWLAWEVFRVRRRVAEENIVSALGVDGSRASRIGQESYRRAGRSFMEFAAFRRITPGEVRKRVRLDGRGVLDAVRAGGRGAIVFLGHFGNWELLAAGFNAYGYPLSGVVGRQSNPHVNRLIIELRRRHSGVIDSGQTRTIMRTVRKNEFVALVADQNAGPDGVFIDFLGRKASAHRGPAAVSIAEKCPVVFAWMERLPGGRFVEHVEGPFRADENLAGEQAIEELTQRLGDRLADVIRDHPEEYFWAHRRWKTQPPGDQSVVEGGPV